MTNHRRVWVPTSRTDQAVNEDRLECGGQATCEGAAGRCHPSAIHPAVVAHWNPVVKWGATGVVPAGGLVGRMQPAGCAVARA